MKMETKNIIKRIIGNHKSRVLAPTSEFLFSEKKLDEMATELSDYFAEKSVIDDSTSDGYHTFGELYEFRMLYNAGFFNLLANFTGINKEGFKLKNPYYVHKSYRHNDGELCFGGGWFIVMAELPTGQISNHYENKYWNLFDIPGKDKANKWDGHNSEMVLKRMTAFLNSKFGYLQTI